jgi:serine/threonine protein kinase
MAEVYLASATGAEGFMKEVVIKVVRSHLARDPQFVTLFIAEAHLASRLNHPNIVQVFDFGKQDDTYYLAMEFIRGTSLIDLRKRCREVGTPFPPLLAAEIGAQVARGLHYAHTLATGGVVHRDVSPHNVLLSFDGAVKLTDFGIAKAANSNTAPGVLKGKYAYMSPEQARGEEVDARTDIFALGIVLWELLTGGRLFDGDSDMAVLRAVASSAIAPPARLNPDIPQPLSDIVMQALSRNVRERVQTASELDKALSNFLLEGPEALDTTAVGDFVQRLVPAGQPTTSTSERAGRPGRTEVQPGRAPGARRRLALQVPDMEASGKQPSDESDAQGAHHNQTKLFIAILVGLSLLLPVVSYLDEAGDHSPQNTSLTPRKAPRAELPTKPSTTAVQQVQPPPEPEKRAPSKIKGVGIATLTGRDHGRVVSSLSGVHLTATGPTWSLIAEDRSFFVTFNRADGDVQTRLIAGATPVVAPFDAKDAQVWVPDTPRKCEKLVVKASAGPSRASERTVTSCPEITVSDRERFTFSELEPRSTYEIEIDGDTEIVGVLRSQDAWRESGRTSFSPALGHTPIGETLLAKKSATLFSGSAELWLIIPIGPQSPPKTTQVKLRFVERSRPNEPPEALRLSRNAHQLNRGQVPWASWQLFEDCLASSPASALCTLGYADSLAAMKASAAREQYERYLEVAPSGSQEITRVTDWLRRHPR